MQAEILSGRWEERKKLPAEAELAAILNVSRGTLRKAIAELTNAGLLVRSHGRGTFVAADALEQPLAERLVTFSEDLISRGIPFETRLLAQEILPASQLMAQRLEVDNDDDLFFLSRVRLVKGEPLIVLHNYVVLDACPGIDLLDFTHMRLFAALEEHFNLNIQNGRRTFQAQVADEVIAGLLQVAPGDPVMRIEQHTYLQNGGLIEYSDLWLRGDQFKLSANVDRFDSVNNQLAVSLSAAAI